MSQQDAVNALDRQLKALELRKAGVEYGEIARALGYKWKSGAFAAVKRALHEVKQEPCLELIKLEVERLDKMQVALWAKAQHGDYGAVDRIIRIMERRARLLGLDAPEKQEVATRVILEIEREADREVPIEREADRSAPEEIAPKTASDQGLTRQTQSPRDW
jgi:preprotein translocase subunit SecD